MNSNFIRVLRNADVPITSLMSQDVPVDITAVEPPAATESPDTPEPQTPVEGLNDDGTLQDGYEKDADGNVVKVQEDPGEPQPADDHETFYEDVQKITGREIKVEYPEAVDPLSSEGVALRETAIYESGAQNFERMLQQQDPRAYAYMLHRQQGGGDETFFNANTHFEMPQKDVLEEDADKQADVLRWDYKQKGIDAESADLLVKNAIAKNTLKDQAVKVMEDYNENQKKQVEKVQAQYEEREREINKTISGMVSQIEETVNKGIRFIIPDANKAEFTQFIKQHIAYDEQSDTFVISQEVNKDNIQSRIEALFFEYRKGNLVDMIEREAKKKVAQSIRLGINKNRAPKGSNNDKNDDNAFVSLSSILPK